MTWWMWLAIGMLAPIIPMMLSLTIAICHDMAILAASAIDRFGDPPEMQMSALLGHVPDRGDDATGDGRRGEVDVTGACEVTQSRD